MAETIVISPVTRINGFWRIDVEVENGHVKAARSSGIYTRGLEQIMAKRDPRDAVYLTQRVCGICSTAHAMAGSLAMEQALQLEIPRNGVIIRNLIFGADLLQNHIRHFYFLTLPDFATGPDEPPFIPRYKTDYRFSKAESDNLYQHYLEAVAISRYCHEMVTVFGGKAPHNHGILIGGASVHPNYDNIRLFMSMLSDVRKFLNDKLLPDVQLVAERYSEYYHIGKGPENFLVYGMFPREDKKGEFYFKPGVWLNGKLEKLEPGQIHEQLKYSWYPQSDEASTVIEQSTHFKLDKKGAYSWIRAPRYADQVLQTGPLCRLWVAGEYRHGISAMDRYMARALEAKKVADLMAGWLDKLEPGHEIYAEYKIPREAKGVGLVEAMRGGLGHWVEVENYHIKNYQIITPSSWNMSPRDNNDRPGAVEEALVGTPIADPKNPIEVGRVARSFDPCSSCAAQVYSPDGSVEEFVVQS